MSRPQTYYDLFAVPPSATLREIRGGYIRLMKRYHPDMHRAAGAGATDFVAVANRCYAVLKDPLKRAAYDAQLSARPDRPPIRGASQTRAPNHRSALASLLALSGAIAVVGGAAGPVDYMDRGVSAEARSFATSANSVTVKLPALMPSADEVRKVVHQAISTPTARATGISQDCYADARAARSEEAAQLCILFDEAALYSSSVWRDQYAGSTYFNADLVQVRQSGALAPFDRDAGRRVLRLRTEAFQQVLREARTSAAPRGGEALSASAHAAIETASQTGEPGADIKSYSFVSPDGK